MITIRCVIKTKERQNVSVGQQILEGLLKNLKHAKRSEMENKIIIGSVMIMTKK